MSSDKSENAHVSKQGMPKPQFFQYRDLFESALKEDLPSYDWSAIKLASDLRAVAQLICKEDIVVCGVSMLPDMARFIDSELTLTQLRSDGESLAKGEVLLQIEGPAKSLLLLERSALNLVARLSGVSTLTRKFVQALEATETKLLDTRKTTPGLRLLEKYATRIGGGHSHRWSLSDGVLIKENHLRIAGAGDRIRIAEYIEGLREQIPVGLRIEMEVTNISELESALAGGVDAVLLDNMTTDELKASVKLCRKAQVVCEASGNITLDRLPEVAETGVDFISTGATIHSARWVDLSLLVTYE